ncbi:MAG: NifB/NifX family molybdenum-iron cluster-binding protein [Oscillospiraceae bacterium]
MILAVSQENGRVCPDFGATKEFLLYDIQAGQIRGRTPCPVDGAGNGALVLCLMNSGANAVLCGSIGAELRALLSDVGIPVFAGAAGSSEDCAAKFLAGELAFTAPPACDGSHCATCGQDCGGGPQACCPDLGEDELDRAPYLERP